MLHVMTILGTRPEIIRLSRVIPALDVHFRHTLVHTGQNHDHALSQIFFDGLGLRAPDRWLGVAAPTPGQAIAKVIAGADAALAKYQPDAVLILGDTDSALAAIPAKRRGMPIFHMEAGNRAFDARIPEEVNRRIVDHIADVNLPYTQLARANLAAEGIAPDSIIVTGSPMREVLDHNAPAFAASRVLADLALEPRGYLALSAHLAETVDVPDRLARLMDVADAVARAHGLPLIVSTHPRTARALAALAALGRAPHPLVRLCPPFAYADWMRLQSDARAVLSDSGTLTEEASILGFPAIALRETHERPEGFEAGTMLMTGLSPERALEALALLATVPLAEPHPDYAERNVSTKIVRILLSYTDWARRRSRG